jgi:hypothetical protein
MVTKVVIESPYSGDIQLNIEYLKHCMHDSYYIKKEAPIASHLLYTRLPQSEIQNVESFCDGHVKDHPDSRHGRNHGIKCGFEWNVHADLVAVYKDEGISSGMKYGITRAENDNQPIEYRTLGDKWQVVRKQFLQIRQLKLLSTILFSKTDDKTLNQLSDILLKIDPTVMERIIDVDFSPIDYVGSYFGTKCFKVLMSGKLCAGKTSNSDSVIFEYPDLTRVSIASTLKWLAYNLYNMSTDPKLKNRKLCQNLGVGMRDIDPMVWINTFFKDCSQYKAVICDDGRFPNEIDALNKVGFYSIRLLVSRETQIKRLKIEYPDTFQSHIDNLDHISETSLDNYHNFDYIFDTGKMTLDDLKKEYQKKDMFTNAKRKFSKVD